MKLYHVILSQNLDDILPILIENYSIGGIFTIGKKIYHYPHINTIPIDIETSEYGEPILLASEIIKRINEKKIGKEWKIVVNLDGENPMESLALFFVAQSFSSSSYIIRNSEIRIIYPLNLIKITPEETILLKVLANYNSFDSIGDLVTEIGWGEKGDANVIAKAVYSTRKLESKGLIKTEREGRSVKLKISDAGVQYCRIFT